VRFFFALWPDAITRARIAAAAAELHLDGGARRVPPENFHVTLAFVGEAAAGEIAALREVGRNLCGCSCVLHFTAYEYWPAPQVVAAVAGARAGAGAGAGAGADKKEGSAVLIDLGLRLRRDLALAPEALRPHVTLARKVTQAPVMQAMSLFEWHAQSFSLMRSDSSGRGSVYTVVDTWPLLDKIPKP
jgi:RNA 2',3'-cyclic 3'-phosphodiesterase